MMRCLVIGCSLLLVVVLSPAWQAVAAIGPGVIVRDIEIRGNRRTQESTIRFYVKTEVGKPYEPQTLSEDIKRLYALRTFDDIQVTAEELADGIRLMITVLEKPAVRNVTFSGRSEEHTSELQSQSNLVCRLLLEKKKKN